MLSFCISETGNGWRTRRSQIYSRNPVLYQLWTRPVAVPASAISTLSESHNPHPVVQLQSTERRNLEVEPSPNQETESLDTSSTIIYTPSLLLDPISPYSQVALDTQTHQLLQQCLTSPTQQQQLNTITDNTNQQTPRFYTILISHWISTDVS